MNKHMKPWYYIILTIAALVLPGIATLAIVAYTIFLLIEQRKKSKKLNK